MKGLAERWFKILWVSPVVVLVLALRGDLQGQQAPGSMQDVDAIITWQVPSAQTVELAFLGRVTGSVLEGVLDDGKRPVNVAGTVAPDGSMSGTLTAQDGSVVGTFAGDETGGGYALDGLENGGTWAVSELTVTPVSTAP